MIIETRYRDIPWEEARKHFHDGDAERWSTIKGRPIRIITPASPEAQDRLCEGPFFTVVGRIQLNGNGCCVCPHIAEIGD